ncbi:MAG: hypothetical protein ACC657_05360 [Thiohalomonadales bacterium]
MKPILISPLALDKIQLKDLNVTADMLFNEGIDCAVLNENDTRGHIIVIDIENDTQQNLLNQTREGQIKILLSTKFFYDKNVISIVKPVSVNALKELIYKISIKLRSTITDDKKELEKNKSDGDKNTDNQTIFHVLLNAKSQKKLLKISCNSCPDLYIDGNSSTLSSTAQHSDLENILSHSFDKYSINDVSRSEYSKLTDNLNISSLDGKLWFTGITCSNGILLQGHDLNKPFKLKAWPNFTRHAFKAEHLKLAAILARQSATINELEISTNISRSEIINFYNAAYSVDLIDIHEKIINAQSCTDIKADSFLENKNPKTHVAKNILHRLATHLHID